MAALFKFEVYTPYRLFFSDSVEAIILTLMDGDIEVCANHSSFTAPVLPCLLRIKDKKGQWQTAFTAEGILEVKDHKTVLVSDSTEWPGEIDHERAVKAMQKAEETLKNRTFKFEIETAASSLKRAQFRIKAWELEQAKQGIE